ncbi:hypothetical protein GP2_066_00050 [Gordonia paraffinivorans NBRC 108238]|uniref:NodB homology domain-containing protein n=1 Tax=Gordonia paraffinivorans NBRC 108238 TaxID=1223543 RepID=A0ABQ0IRS6_9ACTN|nr:polysaccharide deacetylase family protein [Gordonia paraffinivorans]GAC86251.1 hypothetical protein GP2_066_00050 [Gordonia paraffinivorans NBRC 108238]
MSRPLVDEPIRVAVTVDELILWEGSPLPAGYTAHGIVSSMVDTLAQRNIKGCYGFPHTYPVAQSPKLRGVLDLWVDAGHHLGNHTHHHASLNWVTGEQYVNDIDVAESVLGDLLDAAPTRYFRYAMDMTGRSEQKRGIVEDHLRDSGYTVAPITAWFGDFAWIAPYYRAKVNRDEDALAMLRNSYVDAAEFHLRSHSAAARELWGTDVPCIWLIHATPIACDMLGAILDRFTQIGVEFIGLDEAMRHPSNKLLPPVTHQFRNHMERQLAAAGIKRDLVPAEMTAAVLDASPLDGYGSFEVYEDHILKPIAARVGGEWDWDWS